MAVSNWSETILLATLENDPAFTEDAVALIEQITANPKLNAILDFSGLTMFNSANIGKLLKLRKLMMQTNSGKLQLCGINSDVRGVFMVTGLNKTFEFADDVASAAAAIKAESS